MRSLKFFALLVALSTGAWIIPQVASGQQVSASYQLFYDELSPYGTWVDYPNYGYVWIPDRDPGFSPYETAGHWIFTEDGWTWVSDYPWGWAAFHYGRWDYDNYYGWFWVPDDVWGPAWVSWRRSPGYFGWAPLRPGISISIAFGRDYRERNERWIFVRDRDITRPDIGRYYVNRTNNVTIINHSTVIVNTRRDDTRNATYIMGPGRDDVQRATRTTVNSVAIRDNKQPGHRLSNSELQIYRPQVQKRNSNGQVPAPSKVMKLNDVKPASERNAGNRQEQPRTVNPPRVQPPQPPAVNPSDNKGRQQQPRTVNPPTRVQPSQPPAVNPSDNKGRQQQAPTVNPSNRGQSSQPRVVDRSNNKGKEKQPQNVTPPNKGQTPQPGVVNPSNSKDKEKQTQNVAPPKKSQAPQRLDVSRSKSSGKEKEQLKITPPKKQDEKDKQRE
ncbi:MAG: hypothetical protein NTZ35_17955 [Ignavibacteriales bacterium]|nr:hypothetical protein [Ignavibacteriales bacterium]